VPFQHDWNRLGLDRGGGGISGFGKCLEKFGRQLQIGKTNCIQCIVLFVLFRFGFGHYTLLYRYRPEQQ
jgi:hypothetical protein